MNNTSTNRGVMRALAVTAAFVALVAGALWISGIAHAASTEPVISSVFASAGNTSATVTWTTDEAANSQIVYGTSLPYTATSTLDSALVTTHQETLTGLTPDMTYHYEVISTDNSGNINYSGDNTFSTTNTTMLTLGTTSGPTGTSVTVSGSGFSPSETITLSAGSASTTVVADDNGNFSTTWSVPSVSAGDLTLTATGASGDSAQATFDVTTTSTPVIPAVTFSTQTGTPGTPFTVTGSGFSAYEQVNIAFSTSTTSTTADGNGDFSTTVLVPQAGVGTYSVIATGATSGDVASNTFAVTSTPTTTTTDDSTDVATLQAQVSQLQSEVSTLQSQVSALMNGQTVTQTSDAPASIDQNGQTVAAGSTIDFGGHDFDHEENVTVTMNGQTVATAHADDGGNFSTGSLNVPSTPGTYTYTFAGANGDSATATITVQ